MERVRLKVLGITYSQVQQGAYALVLSQVDGPYRIPIVVGTAEAQAIAVRLENITPPRPMPHDIMVSFAQGFGIQLDEVFIYKFDDGIFLSELKFSSEDRQIVLDSRTSDAIALSLRTKSPIYTTPEILKEVGFLVPVTENEEEVSIDDVPQHQVKLKNYAIGELEKMLKKCVDNEEYERAAEIKRIIDEKRASRHEDSDTSNEQA